MVVFFVLNGGTAARHLHYTYLEMRSFTHREYVEKQSLLLHVVYKNKVIEIANNFSMCALLCIMSTIHHPNKTIVRNVQPTVKR